MKSFLLSFHCKFGSVEAFIDNVPEKGGGWSMFSYNQNMGTWGKVFDGCQKAIRDVSRDSSSMEALGKSCLCSEKRKKLVLARKRSGITLHTCKLLPLQKSSSSVSG